MNFWDAYGKYLEREKENAPSKPTPKKKKSTEKKLDLADDVLNETETEETNETEEKGETEDAD